MRILSIISVLMILGLNAKAQTATTNQYNNTASGLMQKDSKLVVGGYGEVHYNQALEKGVSHNGNLDVHRMVMLFGYNFTNKTQFVTELEYEHIKEVYVEQAFLQHKLNNYINLRAGLMLIPMGITNEYHEPSTFNGVERPLIDKYITPTTWREIGFGITGNLLPASLKYQAYIVNGFNGYDGSAHLSGTNGLRKGRQKGSESYISSPNFSGKLEYYAVRGLNLGLSGYFGKTQSSLYDGISKDDAQAVAKADSSVIGVSMVGLDTRYNRNGFQLRGQFYYSSLSNTNNYNSFTGSDIGSSMMGYYAEAGYNVFRTINTEMQLVPFFRYEFLNTHNSVKGGITKNQKFQKDIITTGLTLALTKGVVAKADMQLIKAGDKDEYSKTWNMGIGVMF